ncbi:amidohydrolase family protein [Subtercola lobariae]|uniref:6-methylsalicylate decarboxylase n=1 Tax=Subtercola lobariae TaxID=1588641 RepID=A0A917BBV0_9MICO|nr:amidohydrolase family protein [Subtercola lobariae]GGF34693.1 amidohydrolase [Subtercola lobariae]
MTHAPNSPALIDIHAHFLPPWYVEEAVGAGLVVPDGTPGWPSWSVDDHLRLMDANGITTSVLSISSPGVHFGDDARAAALAIRVNDFAAEVCAEHPDRFDFFATLPLPAVDASLAEAIRGLDELGAVGVAVGSNAQGAYLNNAQNAELWRELDSRGATVFMHPQSPAGWELTSLDLPRSMIEFLFDSTRSVIALALDGTFETYPGLQLVVPHCGAMLPLVADRVDLFQKRMLPAAPYPAGSKRVASETLRDLWYDLAGTPMPTQASALVNLVGDSHVLFGSDHCFAPPALVAEQIASLDEQWRERIGGDWRELTTANAVRLLRHS